MVVRFHLHGASDLLQRAQGIARTLVGQSRQVVPPGIAAIAGNGIQQVHRLLVLAGVDGVDGAAHRGAVGGRRFRTDGPAEAAHAPEAEQVLEVHRGPAVGVAFGGVALLALAGIAAARVGVSGEGVGLPLPCPAAAGAAGCSPGVAGGVLFGVDDAVVRLVHLVHALGGFRVVRVQVGVVFARLLAVRLLHLVCRSASAYPQNLIRVLHHFLPCSLQRCSAAIPPGTARYAAHEHPVPAASARTHRPFRRPAVPGLPASWRSCAALR